MDFAQTLMQMATIIGSVFAAWHAFYYIIKDDIKLSREEFRRSFDRYEVESRELKKELKKQDMEREKRWIHLFKEIHKIKLKQSQKNK